MSETDPNLSARGTTRAGRLPNMPSCSRSLRCLCIRVLGHLRLRSACTAFGLALASAARVAMRKRPRPRRRRRRSRRGAGRRLLRLGQRRLARRPPRSRPARMRVRRPHRDRRNCTRASNGPCSNDASAAPPATGCAPGGRLPRRLPRRGGHRDARLAPLKPLLVASIAGSATRPALVRLLGSELARRRRPAQLGRLRLLASARAGGRDGQPRREELRRLPAAGRSGPAGPRALPEPTSRACRRCAPDTRSTSADCWRSPGSITTLLPARGPRRSWRSRPPSRRATPPARSRPTIATPTTSGRAPTSRAEAPGIDWTAFFAAGGLAQAGDLRRLAARRREGRGGAGRLAAAAGVAGLSALSRARPPRRRAAASAFATRRWRRAWRRQRGAGTQPGSRAERALRRRLTLP